MGTEDKNNPPGDGEPGDEELKGEGGDAGEFITRKDFNAAMTSHFSRFKKHVNNDISKAVSGKIEEALNPVTAAIEALSSKFQGPMPSPGGQGGSTADEISARLAEDRKKYESRIAELENAKRQADEQREAERQGRRRDEERHALRDVLSEQGITGAHQRAAIALLYNEDKRIARDEDDDTIGFKVKRPYGEEIVPLSEGIGEWLKTDDGKAFLPPRGANGSGANGSQLKGSRKGPKTKAEAKQRAALELASAFGMAPKGD